MGYPDVSALQGALPSHQDEVMASHRGTPGTGVPAPEPDHGTGDQYDSNGMKGQ